MSMRLDKFLADRQIGTRSEVKQLIKKGLITVNDGIAKIPEQKINPESDVIRYDGNKLNFKANQYYMLNKPTGYITATKDEKEKTVMDLFAGLPTKDLFPIGRLDKDTEGLLLITNDGALSHELMSPKKHVSKTYFAHIDGVVEEHAKDLFLQGLDIGEKKLTLPAELQIIKSGDVSEILLTITEGKFHQVKRMFEAIGRKVIYLKRVSIGKVTLDDKLALGEYRELTEEELMSLKDNYDINS